MELPAKIFMLLPHLLTRARYFLQTGDGRHKSYYVKKVNRDSLGWRAGILAGDRIIKVDITCEQLWVCLNQGMRHVH